MSASLSRKSEGFCNSCKRVTVYDCLKCKRKICNECSTFEEMKTLKGGEWVKQWVIVKGVCPRKATVKMKATIMKLQSWQKACGHLTFPLQLLTLRLYLKRTTPRPLPPIRCCFFAIKF